MRSRGYVSRVRENLESWLYQEKCGPFPVHMIEQMLAISEDSASENVEMGAPILAEGTEKHLGGIAKGTDRSVSVPRPENAIGSFHTHPHGFAHPSAMDIADMMFHNDTYSCIGSAGMAQTEVNCFTSPVKDIDTWGRLKAEIQDLASDIYWTNREIREKYAEEMKAKGLTRGRPVGTWLALNHPEDYELITYLEGRKFHALHEIWKRMQVGWVDGKIEPNRVCSSKEIG